MSAMNGRASDAQVMEWVARHDLGIGSISAARCALEDARTLVVFQVGDRVTFRGVEHTIFAGGDRPGTFDINQPGVLGADRWLNVPPDQLAHVAGVSPIDTQTLSQQTPKNG